MKKLVALMLCVMLAMTMVSFSAVAFADDEKVLTVGWPYEPSTTDPANASDDASYGLVNLIYESLLRNVNGEAVPGVAESYEVNETSTEYTFHLRENACFSDGTPVTAENFAYALRRLLDPTRGFQQASAGYVIKNGEAYNCGEATVDDLGITVVDDHTLVLTLEYPCYPMTFTQWYIDPIDQATDEAYGIAYGADAANMLTNGAYMIESWVHDSEVVLVKNPNYWDADSIKLDKLVLKLNATGDTAVDMLMAGQLDAGQTKTQLQTEEMTAQGYGSVTESNGVQCVHINSAGATEATGRFLSNANFRKALSYAIDREVLVMVSFTTNVAANRFIYPTEPGVEGLYCDEFPVTTWPTTQDAETAQMYLQAALDELGCTIDDVPTFSILVYDSEGNMICMNAVMDMWEKVLGIHCEIDAQPIQNMIAKMYSGDFDFWKGGISTSGADAFDLFTYYESTQGLFGYHNEAFDAQYEKTQNSTTWAERKANEAELEQIWIDEMMDLALNWDTNYFVYASYVTGVTANAAGVDYTYADINK